MGIKEQIVEISKKHIVKNAFDVASRFIVDHKGTVLTSTTIILEFGGIVTTYRNSPKIHEIIEQYRRDVDCLDTNMELYESYKKEYLKNTLMQLVPLVTPIILFFAGSTTTAIINQKQNEAKIATLTAALSLAKSTISEYDLFKAEATKELGEKKVREIEEDVAKKKAESIQVDQSNGVKVEIGDVLCCIPDFNIFFSSNRDRINLVMDRVNGVLSSNGRDGRSYGNGSRYGNEIVKYSDILMEFNDPQIEIPPLAEKIEWDAGKTHYISYNTFDGGVTRNGIPYLILNIDLSESNLNLA